MPRFAAFLCLFAVASFGLPGTSNFIGEFLVLVGTSSHSFAKVLLAMGGIVLAAAYMLWMLQRVMLGPAAVPRAISAACPISASRDRGPGAAGGPHLRPRPLSRPADADDGPQRDRRARAADRASLTAAGRREGAPPRRS